MSKYDDIINLPHWEPTNHPRMPLANRAAQFAPFAALVGHDEAIRETARSTDQMPHLDSDTASMLNEKMDALLQAIDSHPEIAVTYFIKDSKKAGGSYATHHGAARRYSEAERLIIFADGLEIRLSDIIQLSGPLFADIDNRD